MSYLPTKEQLACHEYVGSLLLALPERITEHIRLADIPHPRLETLCWLWLGRLNRNGYARFCWEGREPVGHRVTYEVYRKPIPRRLVLDHLCRCRACINPWHMEPVTVKINTQRGDAVLFSPVYAQ